MASQRCSLVIRNQLSKTMCCFLSSRLTKCSRHLHVSQAFLTHTKWNSAWRITQKDTFRRSSTRHDEVALCFREAVVFSRTGFLEKSMRKRNGMGLLRNLAVNHGAKRCCAVLLYKAHWQCVYRYTPRHSAGFGVGRRAS